MALATPVRVDTPGILVDDSRNITVDTSGLLVVAADTGGGAGRSGARRARPYWWHSYVEQWLDELEERERELRRQKELADAKAAAERLQSWLAGRPAAHEAKARAEALERARREADAAEVARAVRAARDAGEAERAALGQRAQAALSRVEAKKQQEQAEASAEAIRKLRQIARSPHRRFQQRFEAAIEAARRQGWRAKK